ncbi:heme exporter protein CcmB [Rhodovulum sp. DZ06]|uniref:heme exporter protein CcmB n=1 Tax=Rhodovulum sp. DZ06 TaxID=3425126 RepID=UPI003D34748F
MAAFLSLVLRDLRLAFRIGGGGLLGLGFFLVAVLMTPLGVGPEGDILSRSAPGVIWVAALLACLLSLDRLFQADLEDGSLDQIALSPLPLEAVVIAKSLAHFIATGLPLAAAAPVLALTLHLPQEGFVTLVLSLLIGAPALSLTGAVGAALTVGVRRGGLLLSVLVLPLYVPTLIFGARAVDDAAMGQPPGPALLFLGAVTLLSCAVGPIAAAAALRINLR